MIITMPTVRTTRADQLRQIAPFAVAIDEHRDQEGVDAGDRGGFGRREHAGQDAAENDHDRDHAPDRVERDLERLAERDHFAFREIVAMRDDEHEDDQRQPSSSAGMMPAMNRWATEIVPPAAIE